MQHTNSFKCFMWKPLSKLIVYADWICNFSVITDSVNRLTKSKIHTNSARIFPIQILHFTWTIHLDFHMRSVQKMRWNVNDQLWRVATRWHLKGQKMNAKHNFQPFRDSVVFGLTDFVHMCEIQTCRWYSQSTSWYQSQGDWCDFVHSLPFCECTHIKN